MQSGDGSWALPLGATVLAVRQLGLGGWRPQECLALENELGSWQQSGGFNERGNALRCSPHKSSPMQAMPCDELFHILSIAAPEEKPALCAVPWAEPWLHVQAEGDTGARAAADAELHRRSAVHPARPRGCAGPCPGHRARARAGTLKIC